MKMSYRFILTILWVSWYCLPEFNCQTNFSLGQTIATAGGAPVQNSTFSFGFAESESRYTLGTWYTTDTKRFLLWSAGISTSEGSLLRLEQNGNLAITAITGANWSSGTAGLNVSSAAFLNTGNFVLQNGNGTVVWSTFENPIDTLVTGQALVRGKSLVAGSYSLQVDSGGNMTLSWTNGNTTIAYWGSDTTTGPQTAAIVDTNGVLKIHYNTSTAEYTGQFFPLDYSTVVFRRLTLDADGNLRFYSLTGSAWSPQWQALSDQCNVFRTCGNYGICSLNSEGHTVCGCHVGLKFLNRNEGCTDTGNISQCSTANNRLLQSNNTAWLDNNSTIRSRSSLEQCKSTCQSDASCFGLLVPNDGSGDCVQLRSPVLSAYSTQTIQSIAFLKVCNSAANSPPGSGSESEPQSNSSTWTAVATAVGVTVLAVVSVEALFGWLLYRWRRKKRATASARDAIRAYASGAPIRFTYKELQNASSNFSTKIGEGGFGAVYKGFLAIVPGSKTEVAIKKLEGVFQGDKEFRTEVATIGSTHHMNLMRLIGFCSEGSDTRLLVYEYMPNGSLDRFLFNHEHDFVSITMQSEEFPSHTSDAQGSFVGRDIEAEEVSREQGLYWPTRFKIAVGTAKALAYLHEECRETIIHCDLKPENILLDNNFSPKVSDFGLAKMLNDTTTRSFTAFRGTRGYLAPEWLANMPITSKSDVYSFGMVLFELVGGRRNYDTCPRVPRERHRFPQWVFKLLETDSLMQACDERMESTSVDSVQLERVLKVAFWCIQDSANSRPSMSKVVQMLEGNMPVMYPPMPKSFGESSSSSATTSATSSATSSSLMSSTTSSMYSGSRSLPGR